MRLLAVLVAVCALSAPAIAQTPNCQAAPDVDGRLVCLEQAGPADKPLALRPAAPVSAKASTKTASTKKTSTEKASTKKASTEKAPAAKADPGNYVDMISAEDARMNAQLKNICRGC